MEVIRAMKGTPTTIAAVIANGLCARLNCFGDGSWEIDRNGLSLGCWEHWDRGECLEAFLDLMRRVPDPIPVLWINSIVLADLPANGEITHFNLGQQR